jgi:hypothetical protein
MQFTTGITFFAAILHSAKNTRQTFYRQRIFLSSVEKHSANKNTQQIKNSKKPKNSKTFFILYVQPLPITIPITQSIFTIILNQIYMFC